MVPTCTAQAREVEVVLRHQREGLYYYLRTAAQPKDGCNLVLHHPYFGLLRIEGQRAQRNSVEIWKVGTLSFAVEVTKGELSVTYH